MIWADRVALLVALAAFGFVAVGYPGKLSDGPLSVAVAFGGFAWLILRGTDFVFTGRIRTSGRRPVAQQGTRSQDFPWNRS